jgi:hypothetical protein
MKKPKTLKAFGNLPNSFRVQTHPGPFPQGCRCASNPGLKLANAFGVNEKLSQKNKLLQSCYAEITEKNSKVMNKTFRVRD